MTGLIKILILSIQKQKHFLILIPFLLPLIDFVTDHIFAISTARIVNDSSATSAVAWAMIFNLWLGPILSGEIKPKKINLNLYLILKLLVTERSYQK